MNGQIEHGRLLCFSGFRDRDECIRRDEFMLRVTERQHRARRKSHDALSDAAHKKMREPVAAVRAHHDHVNAFSPRVPDNGFGWRNGRERDSMSAKLPAILVSHQRVET
jgi:hypothetical protein